MGNSDKTVIFAEWDPDEPTIIVTIQNKMLDTPEWQAFRDCFDKLPAAVKGMRTSEDRVMLLKFKKPPPVEFVEHVIAQIKQHVGFCGFPGNEEKWSTNSMFKAATRFADPENVEKPEGDWESAPGGPAPSGKAAAQVGILIDLKTAVVISVGTGEIDVRAGYAALVEAIEEFED